MRRIRHRPPAPGRRRGGRLRAHRRRRQGPGDKPHFTVVLDNAFGIVTGADLKVAGVRAGTINDLRVDPKTHKALVDFEINKAGFGSLRKDVYLRVPPAVADRRVLHRLQARAPPQKLAARRDDPGRADRLDDPDRPRQQRAAPPVPRAASGSSSTSSAPASRAAPTDINEVVRRASPPCARPTACWPSSPPRTRRSSSSSPTRTPRSATSPRTSKTSAAGSSRPRRPPPPRPSAAPTSPPACSASRPSCASCARRWPRSATPPRRRRPRCRTSTRPPTSSPRFLENLKPLSESTPGQPALAGRGLAQGPPGRQGRPAGRRRARPRDRARRRSWPTTRRSSSSTSTTASTPSRRTRAHPAARATRASRRVLQWVFDQSQAINVYDKNGYMLKVNLFHSKCSDYQNPQSLKEAMAKDPSFYKDCAAILGPNQPSITTPDPTATGRQFASAEKKQDTKAKSERKSPADAKAPERSAARPGQGQGRRHHEEARQGRAAQARDRAPAQGDRGRQGRRRQAAQAARGQARHQAARPAEAAARRRPTRRRRLRRSRARSRSAPSPAPSVPDTGATGQLLDYLLAP